MTLEAGDASRPSGLPRSVVPFAGSSRRREEGAAPGAGAAAGGDAILEIFSALSISRAAEDILADLSETGRIVHPRRAPHREAGPVGIARAMRVARDGTGDVLAPGFRAAGAMRMLGLDLDGFFRAYLSGEVASSRGPELDLHHVDLDRGILAPVVPLGLLAEVVGGLALGFRMKGLDRVGIVCDTDGATSTGAWHEGIVFAAARRAPLVLIVESGSDQAALRRQTRVRSFTEKAAGYGVGSASVDGGQVLAVADTVRSAIERARLGEGVQMVEIRYDDRDPIEHLRGTIVEQGLASADEIDALGRAAVEACASAVERVSADATPAVSEGLRSVYTDSAPSARRTWSAPAS